MSNSSAQYDSAYTTWKHWDSSQFGMFTQADSTYFAAELRASGIALDTDMRILEIGYGNGAFLGWATRKSRHYVGTETNKELLDRAHAIGIEVHPAVTDLTVVADSRKFDLIIAFDVLEHLEIHEIITLLRSAARCLSNSGLLIFRVPSGDSPFSGPVMYGDITHKTKLGSSAVRQLASATGLEVVQIRNVTLPATGMKLHLAIAITLIDLMRSITGMIVKIVFNGNKPCVISRNMIAVLRKDARAPTENAVQAT